MRTIKPTQVRLLNEGVQGVFTTLTVGDHITFDGEGGGTFKLTACEPASTVCMVDGNNDVLIVSVYLEESEERRLARERFGEACAQYRTVLEEAADGAADQHSRPLHDALRALIAAADEAVAVGCVFGEELALAKRGLEAVERAAHLEQAAREAREQAEAAQEREALAAAEAAIRAHNEANAAAAAAEELRQRFLHLVPPEPAAGGAVAIRVRTPTGVLLQRRFEPSATLGQVRAWVVTAYPADAPPLHAEFVLKTQPLPGTPPQVLQPAQDQMTVEASGLRSQTLIISLDQTVHGAAGSSSAHALQP